jgi:hypothetical protein
MSFLFGKKQSAQSLAEVLEDGREIMNTEMKKPKCNNYSGREVFIDVPVRVLVKYDPARKEQVTMDDEAPAILERNPQLKK